MPLLCRGSQGPAVATLQAAHNFYLPDLPPLRVDSIFGPKTDARVKEFQRPNKLKPDGIVGPKTEAVIYACVSISACAFAMRRTAPLPQRRFPSVMAGRLSLLPPGGLKVLPASFLQQMASPFQLPQLTPPLIPPFLTPGFSSQLGPGQQVSWPHPSTASSWEVWSIDLMVLSRKLEIKVEIEPEQKKMGSLPGWDINVIGSAKWILLPERHRRPSLFLEAGAKTSVPPDGVEGSASLGIEFKGGTLKFNFGGNPAFDANPQGRAGTDLKVPEANFKVFFEGKF
jgi:hypothetical protein